MKYSTPMMQQYEEIKTQYPDCILFFRLGDFYEMFEDDAKIGAETLDLTLTARPEGKDGRVPMCGVPYHAVDSYLSKLVKAGYKVAICEQIGPIPKYGIVKRDVIRIVTPGTLFDEKSLTRKENNYIISVFRNKHSFALAAVDATTGICKVGEWTHGFESTITNELTKITPGECILPQELYNDPQILKIIKSNSDTNIFLYEPWPEKELSYNLLTQHFKVHTLEVFGIEEKEAAQCAVGGIVSYLKYTQRDQINHLKSIQHIDNPNIMTLDRATLLNLELFTTIRDHSSKGSLIQVIDHTCTAMGGRLLREWLTRPSRDHHELENRLQTVDYFIQHDALRNDLREVLKQITDIERLISRLNVGIGNARDLVHLKKALLLSNSIRAALPENITSAIKINSKSHSEIQSVIKVIETMILEEPGIDIKNANMIKKSVHLELDKLHAIVTDSKQWLQTLEESERQKTGISTLKIKYNQVFGFYIEVSKANAEKVPAHYMRKQTLVNGERFITTELKAQEEIILTAEEKMKEIELQLYQQTLAQVLEHTSAIQESAAMIARLDCLINFAHIAFIYRYTKPHFIESGYLKITQGRHAVVEQLIDRGTFVPNDTMFGGQHTLHLLTGPNMAGKSVYMRQIALITLLAHIGSYVPAEKAEIPIIDRLFVRSGASDVIASGLSTFMVEMVETAHILNNATQQSLIIMDEIGRGTSTYDGIAIAWSVAEYIVGHTKAKTLFATHYHELQELEEKFPNQIKNFHMSVDMHQGQPIFLHSLREGPASHSYGISVAKKAGLPNHVISRAEEIAHTLETAHTHTGDSNIEKIELQPALFKAAESETIIKTLKNTDISNTTPIQALLILAKLKEQAV